MSAAGTIAALAASVVIVLGGAAAGVRMFWKIAQTVRDNTAAIHGMRAAADKRFDELSARLERLERRRRF